MKRFITVLAVAAVMAAMVVVMTASAFAAVGEPRRGCPAGTHPVGKPGPITVCQVLPGSGGPPG
jgi:hypothetical protein